LMTQLDIWDWKNCKVAIRSLRGRLGFPNANELSFLGFRLQLADGHIFDKLEDDYFSGNPRGIYFLLAGYANSQEIPETSELTSFAQLRGGRAFQRAFMERAMQPIAKNLGSDCSALRAAGRFLKGQELSYGDCSICIHSFPLIPVTIILWTKTSEFPAKANILFNSSASNYLSTEELAGLGQLTSSRIIAAAKYLNEGEKDRTATD
ncbi:MAG: DUF3786 domain-containing protein, partial [Candidatus Hodarchaeota archaeon]